MSTHVVWRKLTQAGSFRWSDVAPRSAARAAFGVVFPLALGWAAGHVDYGGYAALGALPVGVVSFQGETRSRVMAVAVASAGMAVSTFVGAITAAIAPWLLVAIVAIWGYITGLAVSVGQRVSIAVLQWSIALLIAVGLPFGPSEAALRAGLVLAGGALQAVLVAASWTFRPGASERKALAASYRTLAAYAFSLAAGRSEPPPPTAFPASTAVDDPNPMLSRTMRLMFVDLLEEAERIRASLAALATEVVHERAKDAGEVRDLLVDAASALNLIADALTAARAEEAALVSDLNGRIAQREIAEDAPWRWAGEAVLGQLRAVGLIIANLSLASTQRAADGKRTDRIPELSLNHVAAALATMRANVTVTSEAGRHALRLAAVAALAEVVVQATGLYQGRWVTLTIFLVAKPDYASTLYRGVQRAVGTMLGAGVGAAAVEFVHLGQAGLVAAAGACVAAAYALFDASYLLFSVSITAFVVVLLDLLGTPAIPTAEARFFDTLIGSALALVGYLAWPTWEGATAQEKFGRLVEAHREYATALLRVLAHPGRPDAKHLRALQIAARGARSDAEAAAARMSGEPVHAPLTPEVARLLMAAVARLAHATLALHALALSQQGPTGRQDGYGDIAPRVNALGEALCAAMGHLASALRTLRAPQPIPSLRPIQATLRDDPALRGAAFVGITDRLVDAVNTLDAILRDGLSARR